MATRCDCPRLGGLRFDSVARTWLASYCRSDQPMTTTETTAVLLTNEKKVALLRIGAYLLVLGLALAAAGSPLA